MDNSQKRNHLREGLMPLQQNQNLPYSKKLKTKDLRQTGRNEGNGTTTKPLLLHREKRCKFRTHQNV